MSDPPEDTVPVATLAHNGSNGVSSSKALTSADLVDQCLYLPKSRIISITLSMALLFALAIMEQTILAVALPAIGTHFRASDQSSWVVNAFLLGSAAFAPVFGRLSDVFGRKLVMQACTFIFLVFTGACAGAPSIYSLIIFRALQGIGASGSVAVGYIVLADVIPNSERGKYQGIIEIVCLIASGGGAILGGVLVEALGWRSAFYVILPFLVVCIIMQWWLIPSKPMTGSWKSKMVSIDYVGSTLILAATVFLLVGLVRGGADAPWTSPSILVPLILFPLLMAAFVVWESKFAALPVVPMSLFRNATVTSLHLSTMASFAAHFITLFYIPVFLQVVQGLSFSKTGLVLLPYSAVLSVFVWLSMWLSKRYGTRTFINLGYAIWSIFGGLCLLFKQDTPVKVIVGVQIVGGVGIGLSNLTSLLAIQAAVARHDVAVVLGSRNYARLLGSMLGTAIGSAILSNSMDSQLRQIGVDHDTISEIVKDPSIIRSGAIDAARLAQCIQAYVSSFHKLFIVVLTLLLFCFIVSITLLKDYSLVREDDEARVEEGLRWMAEQNQKGSKDEAAKDEKMV